MFGRKSRMERALAQESSIDFDFEIDLGDLGDGISDEYSSNEKSRKPILKATKDFGKGVGTSALSKAGVTNFLRKALPAEYGQFADNMAYGKNELISGLSDSTSNLNKIKREAQSLARQAGITAEERGLSKLSDFLKKIGGTDDSVSITSRKDEREKEISSTISSLFAAQETLMQRRESIRNKKEQVKEAVEATRFDSQIRALGSIDKTLRQSLMFNNRTTFNFYRKSIELQLRQYHVLTDIFAEQSKSNKELLTAINDIKLNTGLPDFVKMQTKEAIKQLAKQRAIDGGLKKLFGTGSFLGNIGKMSAQAIGDRVGSATELLSALVGAGQDGLNMASEAGDFGPSMYETGGSLAGDSLMGLLGKRLRRAGSNTRLGKKTNQYASRLNYLNQNMGDILEKGFTSGSYSRKTQNTYAKMLSRMTGRDIEEFEDSGAGFIDGFFSFLSPLIQGANSKKHRVEIDGIGGYRASGPNARLSLSQRAQIEVIPGFLSRILQQVSMIRTGSTNVPSLEYDYKSGKFVNSTRMRNIILREAIGNNTERQAANAALNALNSAGLVSTNLAGKKVFAADLTAQDVRTISQIFINGALSGQPVTKEWLTDPATYRALGQDKANAVVKGLSTKGLDELTNIVTNITGLRDIQINTNTIEGLFAAGKGNYLMDSGLVKQSEGFGNQYELSHGAFLNLQARKTRKFAAGGYTGPGERLEPAGTVHKGEVVFSQDDVKRWGGYRVVEELRRSSVSTLNSFKERVSGYLNKGKAKDIKERTIEELQVLNENISSRLDLLGSLAFRQVAETSALSKDNPHSRRFLMRSRRYFNLLSKKARDYNSERFKSDLKRIKDFSLENARNLQQEAMNPENYRKIKSSVEGFIEENKGLSLEEIKDKYSNKYQDKLNRVKSNVSYVKSLLTKGKDKLFNRVSDVYHASNINEPILKARDVLEGKIRDADGKVIKALNEVTSNLYDEEGNLILSYQDFQDSIVKTKNGLWQKVKEASWFNNKHLQTAKWVGLGLATLSMGPIVPMAYIARKFYKEAGKELSTKWKGRFRDVYIRGEDKPALLARKLRLGHYAWVDDSQDTPEAKVIQSLNDIAGPVIDLTTKEYVISRDDLNRGLVDSKGRPLDMGIGRRLLNIPLNYMKWAGGKTLGMLSRMGKAGAAVTRFGFKMAYGAASGFAKGFMKGLGIGNTARTVFDKIQSKLKGPEDIQYANLLVGDEGNRLLMSINAQLANGAIGGNKKVFGDVDGDGDRDNSIADLKQREKEEAKEAREDSRFARLANMIGKTVNGIGLDKKGKPEPAGKSGGLMSMVSGALGAFAGAIMSKIGAGFTRMISKVPGGAKLLGAAGLGGSAAKGVGLMSRLGRGALGLGGRALGLAGSAYSAYSAYDNIKKGNYGSAALDVGLAGLGVAMTPGAGAALMTGAGFLATNPIGWVILGGAAIGYGAYKLSSYLKNNKINKPVIARMLQYGFKEKETDYIKKMLSFERLLEECTTSSGAIDKNALAKRFKDVLSIFKIEQNDQEQMKRFQSWYLGRFSPIFNKARTAVTSIKPGGVLSDAASFRDKQLADYYTAITPSPGQYTSTESPFPGHVLSATSDDAIKYIQENKDKNPSSSSTVKNLGSLTLKYSGVGLALSAGKAVGHLASKAWNMLPSGVQNSLKIGFMPITLGFSAVKGIMGLLGFNTKEEISASTGNESASGPSKDYDPTRSIVFKMFGLMNLNEFNKVSAVSSLMATLDKKIRWRGTKATFGEDLADFATENCGLFKIDKEDKGGLKTFIEYLKYRFIPVYLNLLSSIKTHLGSNGINGLYSAQVTKKLTIVNEVLTAKVKHRKGEASLWDYSVSPWGDKLNTSAKSIDEDLKKLETEVKSKDTNANKTEALAKTEKTKLASAGITGSAFSTIKNTLGSWMDSAKETISGMVPQSFKDTWERGKEAVSSTVGGAVNAVGEAVSSGVDWVASKLSGSNKNNFRTIMEAAAKAGEPHPAVLAAQWALESGWGKHQSGKNNFFGIKARPGQPHTMRRTREVYRGKSTYVMAPFADYASLEDGIAARVAFIRENKRYTEGGYYSAQTPADASIALQRAGYATDPGYAKSLIGIIKGAGIDPNKPSVQTSPEVGRLPKPSGTNTGTALGERMAKGGQGTTTSPGNHPTGGTYSFGNNSVKGTSYTGSAARPSIEDGGARMAKGGGSFLSREAKVVGTSVKAQKAADYASSRARSKSSGYCARYVRQALQAAGYKFTPHGAAYQYATSGTMEKMGFTELPQGTPEAKGDVIVWNKIPGHPYGHIQIYDGNTWVSDFKHRRNLNPYGSSPHSRYWHYRDTSGMVSNVSTTAGSAYSNSVASIANKQQTNTYSNPAGPAKEDLFSTVSIDEAMGNSAPANGTNLSTGGGPINNHVEQLQASLRHLLGIGTNTATSVEQMMASTANTRAALKGRFDEARKNMVTTALNRRGENQSLIGSILGFSPTQQALNDGYVQSTERTTRRQAEVQDLSQELLKETKEQTKTLKEILATIRSDRERELSARERVSYREEIAKGNQVSSSPVVMAKGNI